MTPFSDLSFFREHGYQILRDVIPRETADSLRVLLYGAVNMALEKLKATVPFSNHEELIARIAASISTGTLDRLDRDSQMTMTGHFPLETRLSPELWQVPRLPNVRNVIEEALGKGPLFMHMPPTARFVLSGNSAAAVPPHRDVSYNTHMRDFVILWVPLTSIDDLCGGVAVYEGSQNDCVQAEGGSNFWLKGVPTDGYERVHCKMDVGDALLLSQTMLHASVPNRSDRTRCSIDYRFVAGDHSSSKHVLDLQTWSILEPEPLT